MSKLVTLKIWRVWMLLSCSFQTTTSIKTDHCSHYRLEKKFKNTLKCLLNNVNEVMKSDYGNQHCYNFYKRFPCFNDQENILNCIGEENKNIVETFIKLSFDDVLSPAIFPCKPQPFEETQKFEKTLLTLENATIAKTFLSNVKFDKKLSFHGFKWDLLRYKNGTTNHMLKAFYIYGTYTLKRNERCIAERIFPLIVNHGFGFLDDWLLPCHVFVDINEDCMKPNDFLSPRDTKLLKHLAITVYKQFMESLLDINHTNYLQLAYNHLNGISEGNSANSDTASIRRDFQVIQIDLIYVENLNTCVKIWY